MLREKASSKPEIPEDLKLRMNALRTRTTDVLQANGLEDMANRLRKCCILPNGIRSYCFSSSYCPRCISAQAYGHRTWLLKTLRPLPPPKITWLHLTTVVPDCLPCDLGPRTHHAVTLTRQLLQHPAIAPSLHASFSAVETPPATLAHELDHPHVHTIAGVDYQAVSLLQDVWANLPGVQIPMHVEPIERSRDGFITAVRYVTKQAYYDDPARSFLDYWNRRLDDPGRFIMEVQQLAHRPRFFGSLIRPKTVPERMAWTPPWPIPRPKAA